LISAFPDGLLDGKTAFVAGGTSGVNLAIALRMSELGARVAVLGRNPEKAHAAADTLGRGAMALASDVRDYAATQESLRRASDAFGGLDIVVSGAAGNFVAPALDMSANGFKAVIDIDLIGTFNVFRACYDFLRRPGASLITLSAGQATVPLVGQSHACAAKAGINHLVRVLAMEWGPTGVRVNGLAPGPVAGTEGMARLTSTEEAVQRLSSRIPMRRYAHGHEIAEAAVFLCSASASYITGTILDCDGGAHLGDSSTPQVG